jgi:hypothetical protein
VTAAAEEEDGEVEVRVVVDRRVDELTLRSVGKEVGEAEEVVLVLVTRALPRAAYSSSSSHNVSTGGAPVRPHARISNEGNQRKTFHANNQEYA